jgi:predicted permease
MDAEVFRTPAFSWVEPVARLRPGVTHAAASAELNQILSRMPRDHETSSVEEPPIKTPMSVMPITQSAALRDREALVRFVRLMFGVVLLTLLLACANVANLLLVRSSERAQELGVRAALGAGRMRIVRQLFIENTMLAAGGALVGLVVAFATVRALSAFTLPGSIALSQLALAVDARVLGFTATVAVATALMFGLVPAIRASRLDLATFMRNERASRPGGLLRSTLVATQAALALALLIGATLFTRSVRAGLTTDLGFDPHPLAAVTVDLRVQGYDRVRTLEYYREAIRRLRRHPEIAGVAVASHVPLARTFSLPFKAPDAITARARSSMLVPVNAVSEDYFRTLALPVLRGRAFTAADTSGGQRSIMLNEAAARVLWGTAEAIGRGLVLFGGTPYTVIGIVKTTKYESVRDEDRPVAYLPVGNDFGSGASIVVRSDSPRAALRTLQSELAAIDPTVTLRKPRLVGDQIDDVLMPQRFGSRLFAIFSLIALVIACVGVHGVVAYGVSLRQRELGIRIALGARPAHIYTVVLRDSLIAVGVGATVGLAVAIMASPALAAFLYGIKPLDTPAFIAALGALVLAAVAATSAPARRASRTDPAASIRVE